MLNGFSHPWVLSSMLSLRVRLTFGGATCSEPTFLRVLLIVSSNLCYEVQFEGTPELRKQLSIPLHRIVLWPYRQRLYLPPPLSFPASNSSHFHPSSSSLSSPLPPSPITSWAMVKVSAVAVFARGESETDLNFAHGTLQSYTHRHTQAVDNGHPV